MNWPTIIWSMAAATSLTLASIHLLFWLRAREARASLVFSVAAVAAAAVAILELAMMQAGTPAEFSGLLRWMHVPVGVIAIAIVWFIRLRMHAGRLWLAWLIVALRISTLVVNFTSPTNATFTEVASLERVSFLGSMVSTPEGTASPMRILVQLSGVFMLAYVIEATIASRRHPDRRRAMALGIAITCTIVISIASSQLMVLGYLPVPVIGLNFLLIVVVLACELSLDLLHATRQSVALRQSQRRASLAARALSLQMWEWDIVNDQIWTTLSGDSPNGDDGRQPRSLDRALMEVHEADRETVRRGVSAAIENGTEFTLEYRMALEDGSIRWTSTQGQVEMDERNTPVLVRGVSRDVTAQKALHTEYMQQRDSLLHLQRVDAMEQLSFALAHEIRQPLGAILRNAEAAELFLRQQPPDLDEVHTILSDIRRDEERAAAVITNLGRLVKKGDLDFTRVGLDEVAASVEEIMRAEFQARSASSRSEISDGLPDVRADRMHLQQVLINLLLNALDAIEHLPDGQREIVISASSGQDEMIEVGVTDRGKGISPDHMPHLFEPFFTSKANGTGIGLAVCKTILDMHGGQIWAEHNPGGGTTMRFTLHTYPE